MSIWLTLVGALGSGFNAVTRFFGWLSEKAQRLAGRNEARLNAAEREAKLGRQRQRTNEDVRNLDLDALERELRGED